LESRVRSIRPQEVPKAHPFGRRRGEQEGRPQRAFELNEETSSDLPDDTTPNEAPDDRDVSPPAPDEAGRRLDVTG
jgi:hypothetical protein